MFASTQFLPKSKVYTTENAWKSHLLSKKHREASINVKVDKLATAGRAVQSKSSPEASSESRKNPEGESNHITRELTVVPISGDPVEDSLTSEMDRKIAAAHVQLSASDCLFCSNTSASLEENLSHMSLTHSFFIPDAEYLTNVSGLVTYLGEKIAVGNVCIYCNAKSREFRSLAAVRKHMIDKGHCKIAYESEDDQLEISDFYDFSSSYPDNDVSPKGGNESTEEEWEDVHDDDLDVDSIVDESEGAVSGNYSRDDSPSDNRVTYGDTEYELVLPSGTRIGHRSLRRYYAQSFRFTHQENERAQDPLSGAALVRRLLADKNAAFVPRKGGYGAFGQGTDIVKARNPGEARNAGRHIREHRDQRRMEEFRTSVAFRHNHQKHYRDPC